MPDGQNKVPDWLRVKQSSDKSGQNNGIKRWLLRSPSPSRTAWVLFLMGAILFIVLTILHIAYSLRFEFIKEGPEFNNEVQHLGVSEGLRARMRGYDNYLQTAE
jgi:hypothetical protein